MKVLQVSDFCFENKEKKKRKEDLDYQSPNISLRESSKKKFDTALSKGLL